MGVISVPPQTQLLCLSAHVQFVEITVADFDYRLKSTVVVFFLNNGFKQM